MESLPCADMFTLFFKFTNNMSLMFHTHARWGSPVGPVNCTIYESMFSSTAKARENRSPSHPFKEASHRDSNVYLSGAHPSQF